MPPYLHFKGNTYYFRRAVPAELRPIIGRREIKKSVGRDYDHAVRECRRKAVLSDELFDEARTTLDSIPVEPTSRDGIRRTRLLTLKTLNDATEQQFANLMRASLLDTDRRKRAAGMSKEEFAAYGEEIQASLDALRQQVASGNLGPAEQSAHTFLAASGYLAEFSPEEWRRLAYTMTEATLEAYEGMARRQEGRIVRADTDDLLPNQYVEQNRRPEVSADAKLTWEEIFAVWKAEVSRPDRTRDAYLAAVTRFRAFCDRPPEEIQRTDVLAYREHMIQTEAPAPGTLSNKIGFLCTLFNSARDNSKYANRLSHNPFAEIKIKRAKRGKSDQKRKPFSDAEIRTIFTSPIYTHGKRPHGGGGEAAAWLPAIAYLTGMRLEEMALLRADQFHVDAKGNPYIQTGDGKTESSADRQVPLHPALIEAGLLRYVNTCKGRLFPRVKCANEIQSAAYSKWFGRYLDALKITSRAKVFHSFRHLFKDLCRNAGIEANARDQICGHEPGSVGDCYGQGFRVDVLAEMVRRIEPPVKLPIITP